jgi:hypothetical protein
MRERVGVRSGQELAPAAQIHKSRATSSPASPVPIPFSLLPGSRLLWRLADAEAAEPLFEPFEP